MKEKVIEYFINKHQDFLDNIFKNDIDYQNAQKDIGEIEYISFTNPEDVIHEKQYAWCKENLKGLIFLCTSIEYKFNKIFKKGGE